MLYSLYGRLYNRAYGWLESMNIDIQIEHWPIERLIPRVNNPRTHSREQVAQIAASIREFDWTNPILVDEGDEILAGHARVLAGRNSL
jgi:ParB-like chromosome segregation protein Spo0J